MPFELEGKETLYSKTKKCMIMGYKWGCHLLETNINTIENVCLSTCVYILRVLFFVKRKYNFTYYLISAGSPFSAAADNFFFQTLETKNKYHNQ